MTTHPHLSPASLPADHDAWPFVEGLLDEIADLARSEMAPAEFHAELLDRAVRAVAAVGGAVWFRDPSGRWEDRYQIGRHAGAASLNPIDRHRHTALLEQVWQSGAERAVPPGAGDVRAGNPLPFLLLLAPLKGGDQTVGVLEVHQRAETLGEAQRGQLRIVSAAAELAEDFYRERLLRKLTDRETVWSRFGEFCEAVHRSLDLKQTAYAIANEGCRLLGCDRVSVLVRRGGGFRLLAVSGVDVVHRRANAVRRLERLTKLAIAVQETLWFPDDSGQVAPEIEAALQSYLDESHARRLALVPLVQRGDSDAPEEAAHGALVVEHFDARVDRGLGNLLQLAGGQAASALGNAMEYDGLPLLPVLRWIRGARWYTRLEQLPKSLSVAGGLILLAAVLFLTPADFEISARGQLQPLRRAHVFAPGDGIVVELPSRQSAAVAEGETLAVLRSPQLEIALSEVVGKKRTLQEQLDGIQAARMRNERLAAGAADRLLLSAQERQLREEFIALEAEHQILLEQQRDLQVRSPLRGQVLTWDIERLLAERPVHRGDHLMSVADLDGPWELLLQLDDDQSGHVMTARATSGPALPVAFQLASQPGVRFRGRLQDMGATTEVDEAGRPIVPATVALEGSEPPPVRPGATVTARIHCGRRSLGYVWFRSLYEAIVSRL